MKIEKINLILLIFILIGVSCLLLVNTKKVDVRQDKSFVEIYKIKDTYLDSTKNKSPESLGLEEVAQTKIACPEAADGPCGFDLMVVVDKQQDNNFYLVQSGGAMYSYYGPFNGNLEKIINEASLIDSVKDVN